MSSNIATANRAEQSHPNLWSWRKGVFRFTSHKTTVIAKREVENLRLALAEMNLPDNNNFLLPVEDLRTLIAQTEQRNPQDPLLARLYVQLGESMLNG